MCVRVFYYEQNFDKNYVNFNFQNLKINFIRFEILLHNCTNCTKLNWDIEIFGVSWVFCFFELHLNCTYCTNHQLNWDIEIFGVSEFCFFWTAPELHLNLQKTKIVKFFSNQWIFFLVFIFNYELDIFYPFFKNDKNAF